MMNSEAQHRQARKMCCRSNQLHLCLRSARRDCETEKDVCRAATLSTPGLRAFPLESLRFRPCLIPAMGLRAARSRGTGHLKCSLLGDCMVKTEGSRRRGTSRVAQLFCSLVAALVLIADQHLTTTSLEEVRNDYQRGARGSGGLVMLSFRIERQGALVVEGVPRILEATKKEIPSCL